jgi:hypothetical protein
MNNEIELKKVYVKPQMSVLEFDQEEPLLCCSADDDEVGVTLND